MKAWDHVVSMLSRKRHKQTANLWGCMGSTLQRELSAKRISSDLFPWFLSEVLWRGDTWRECARLKLEMTESGHRAAREIVRSTMHHSGMYNLSHEKKDRNPCRTSSPVCLCKNA
jgi:UV DNA damage repair endonuclease